MSREEYLLPSVVEAIGSTPLVELSRIAPALDGRIFVKLEFLNPGLSKKDRIARQIIEDAERNGQLSKGQTVVELTSGNTGTGLGIVCAVKGYPFVAVMSKGNSVERARMMRALGVEVVLVDQQPGSVVGQVSGEDLVLVEIKVQQIVRERNAFRADQFVLEANHRAHYLYTAQEIIRQCEGKFDAFCDFVGSGGVYSGCSRAFKEYNSSIQCYIVEPANAPVLAGKNIITQHHRIQGGGYSKTNLKLLENAMVDGYVQVTDEEAIHTARELAVREGIFAGFSSGANVAAAIQLLNGPLRGKTVCTMINDSGLKYLSTDLWK